MKKPTTKTTKDAEPRDAVPEPAAVDQADAEAKDVIAEAERSLSEEVNAGEAETAAADPDKSDPEAPASDETEAAQTPDPEASGTGEIPAEAGAVVEDDLGPVEVNQTELFLTLFMTFRSFLEALPPQPEPCESKRVALCNSLDGVIPIFQPPAEPPRNEV